MPTKIEAVWETELWAKPKGKTEKATKSDTGSGIRVDWAGVYALAEGISKVAPTSTKEQPPTIASDKIPEPTLLDTKQTADDQLGDLVLQNPQMSAATLVNTMKAKGLGVVDKKQDLVTNKQQDSAVINKQQNSKQADSGSSQTPVLRQSKKESASSSISFRCRIKEGSAKDNGIGITKFKAVLIQEGLGNFKDCYYYTRQALESAIPLFEGKKIYADHPSKFDEDVRPERSVRDILGYFESVSVENGEDGQAMLTADVVMLPDEEFRWARSLMTHSVQFAKQYPDKEFVGLSINASGDASTQSIQDFLKENKVPDSAIPKIQKAMDQGIEEINLVTTLTDAVSCDLVTEPGAGGKVLQLLEMEKTMKKESKNKEAEEKKEGALPPAGSKPEKCEAEEDKAEGDQAPAPGKDGDGHGDEDDDKALIKKMLKQYLGDEHEEDEAAHGHAKQAYEAYQEMGMEKKEAFEAAGNAMKLAKHMAQKKAEAEEKPEPAADEDKKDDDKKDPKASAPAKEAAKEIAQLKGELARFKEAARKVELVKVLDKKLESLKEARRVTDEIRKLIGEPKNEAHIDQTISSFMSGYKARSAGEADFSDVFVMTEKQAKQTEVASKLSFEDCLSK